MATPKRKTSSTRRDKRRSHQAIADINLVKCTNCGELHRFHHVCEECGYYRGRKIMDPVTR